MQPFNGNEEEQFRRVYLDYNATTPVEPEVIEAITEALREAWGNPSSSYRPGEDCAARGQANNFVFHTAVKYFWDTYKKAKIHGKEEGSVEMGGALPHIITSNVEHDSINLVAEQLVKEGKAEVTFVQVSKVTARVEVEDVMSAIRPNTCLISIMLANNETGVLMPIAEISQRVQALSKKRGAPRILLHTDAAQAIGKLQVDTKELGVDYLTIVGHKASNIRQSTRANSAVFTRNAVPLLCPALSILQHYNFKHIPDCFESTGEYINQALLWDVLQEEFYAPRIGALYVKGPGVTTPVYPLFFGGGQERNFRPGTENTPMIAGLGKPIAEISQRVQALSKKRGAPRILLHTDAAQAIGKLQVDTKELGVDYLTIVGHKASNIRQSTRANSAVFTRNAVPLLCPALSILQHYNFKHIPDCFESTGEYINQALLWDVLQEEFYAPRIGALYVKGPGVTTPVYPLFFGGGQERNFRPGTENTPMIAGLGKAAELVHRNLERYAHGMRETCEYLEQRLEEVFGKEKLHFNSHFSGSKRLPNTCNVSFLGVHLQGRKVLSLCHRLLASVGAACHSDQGDSPSPILLNCGIPPSVAANALRLSVGRGTTKGDVDVVIEDLRAAVQQLEGLS
ncbi:UNVERIFIED_CONTAM: hypothetical protein FKN15_010956 [Acipenser sinensis]